MRKRKQYNPLKQVQILANQSLRHSAIGCVIGEDTYHFIDLRSKSTLPVTKTQDTYITSLRHQWSYFIAVIGIDSNGEHYMKANEVTVVNPTFQSDLVEPLNKAHSQLIKEFNPKHLLSVAWLATPYLKEWDEKEAFDLLERLGALDFKVNDVIS